MGGRLDHWRRKVSGNVSAGERPADLSPRELGFQRQEAVRWLAPKVLVNTGVKALLATIFGSYADKRELQGSLPSRMHRHGGDEMWFDFVADLGDGFDATYSVATLLGRPELDVPGAGALPRGEMLVMGGDQVYPAASVTAYRDRTKGVYAAALPHVSDSERPTIYALPGNHDWYDGLTAFLRVFAQGRPIGGWDTAQTRSYFAVELPHRWWLYAIDTQFDDHIDAPQLAYFTEAAEQLRPGDAVILCTPSPSWISAHTPSGAESWDMIEFFRTRIIEPTGASIRLMLSGDKHHYTRYTEHSPPATPGSGAPEPGSARQKITCGLGGAYLAVTDELPESVVLPPPTTRIRAASPSTRFDLTARYPDHRQSKLFAAGILRLPWRNPGFWGLAGILQSILTLAVLFGLAGPFGEGPRGFFALVASWTPAVALGALVLTGWVAFARLHPTTPWFTGLMAGLLHGTAHLGLTLMWGLGITWLYRSVIPDDVLSHWLSLPVIIIGVPAVLGFVHSEVVAIYLMIASRFGINLNEVMAGQSIEDHKGFLRLHIDREGTLRVYPVILGKVCRAWTAAPDGEPDDPHIRPVDFDLRPELIEEPIVISRADTASA